MARALRVLPLVILAVMLAFVAVGAGTSTADPQPAGTYARTCQNISFNPTGNDRWLLKATCKNVQGNPVQTELLYDIANCDGKLKWAPGGC